MLPPLAVIPCGRYIPAHSRTTNLSSLGESMTLRPAVLLLLVVAKALLLAVLWRATSELAAWIE